MFLRDGLPTDTEIFVTHGHQHISLLGFNDLEPGGLLGTSSSPLIKIPSISLHDFPMDSPTPPATDAHALHDSIPVTEATAPPTDDPSSPPTPCNSWNA